MVTICSPRPIRAVQRARLWAITCTASQAPLVAKRPDGMWVQPDAVLEVAYGVLDLGVAAVVGLQFQGLSVPVGDEAVIAVGGEEGGSQFTSEGFTGILARHGVKISMDGKGRYADNIFMERLWRTVKYEEVYLKAYSNGREAKSGLEAYLHFYNTQRPHQALGYRTPAEVFSGDSVQSDEQSKERRWLPTRALVDLGKTAGPSLNIAPILSN